MKRTIAFLLAIVLALGMLSGCGKTELPAASAESAAQEAPKTALTRADVEKAAVAAAWAYYFKDTLVQYDSEILTPDLSKYYGGSYRLTEYAAPEYGPADETIQSVCSDFTHKVWYNGTGINVLGGALNSVTTSCWEDGERDGIMVMRFVRDDYELKDRDIEKGISLDSPIVITDRDAAKAWFTDYEKNMRPGDWVVSTGHAMLYVGNGYIIDCAGKKYDMETGVDAYESKGALRDLHDFVETFAKSEGHLGHYGVDGKNGQHIVILRPTNYICTDDGDGNPANDPVTDETYRLPEGSLTREQFDGLEIQRTSTAHNYQAVEVGGTITYSIQLSNCSNNADYVTYRQRADAAYSGNNFVGVPVTETVPDGVELVSADGAAQDGKTLTWSVDLAAGETKTVSYTVKVTAPRGTVITNDGGFVGAIPSNTLTATVGGKLLTEEDTAKLQAFGKTEKTAWYENYNIGDCSGLTFAEKVYKDVLGINLELPSESDVFTSLFEQYHHTAQGMGYRSDKTYEGWPYVLKADDGSELRRMLVNGYVGGKGIYFAKPEVCLQEFNFDYLQPGDILLNMKLNGEVQDSSAREVTLSTVLVYLGNCGFAYSDEFGAHFVDYGHWAKLTMWETFLSDCFVALRPTQAYDDIHTLTYDASKEEKMPEPKKNAVKVKVTTPLADAYKAKISALSADAFEDKNLAFADSVYKEIGLESVATMLTKDDKALTMAGYLTAICPQTDSTNLRGYIVPRAEEQVDAKLVSAYRMLISGYYGGKGMVTEDIPGVVTDYKLSDLEVGDIVCLVNWSVSHYRVMVYQGGGKFLSCEHNKEGIIEKAQKTLTDAEYAATLTSEDWLAFYVLRPANAFENNFE